MAAMRDPVGISLAKWPFLAADALLLTTAYLIYRQSTLPMGFGEVCLAVLCVAGGACLSIAPFLAEYRLAIRLAETQGLTSARDQLRRLESLAAQMTAVVGQWRAMQEEVDQTRATAKGIAERMGTEAQGLTEPMPQTNDSEKASPGRNGVRSGRSEDDCLQVLVEVLDHVYALHVGALRSGQPDLIEQLSNFQDTCRAAARRIGLTPFIAEPAGPFDAQRHRSFDGESPVPTASVVAETIAAGYTFRGRLLRPALVRLLKRDEASKPAGQTGAEQSPSGSEAKEPA